MRANRTFVAMAALAMILSVGCAQRRAENPSMKDNVENSLKQAGFNDVNVDEDRDKGVVTIKGNVASQADKQRAEEVARQSAGNSVIANEILVAGGDEGRAEDVAGAKDDAIESNFKAYVEQNKLDNQYIRADATNGVLTLEGDVDTPAQRSKIEKDAAKIEGVTQVVNKLEVKGAKGRKASANQ
jgi:hyperosmotically inducible protein